MESCSGGIPWESGDIAPRSRSRSAVERVRRKSAARARASKASDGEKVHSDSCFWLYDQNALDKRGQKFDSSRDRGEPLVFRLGTGRVIRGWVDGIAGMQRGGKRELQIPSGLGYGARGAGKVIPPGASLVFEVELLDIRK